MVIVLVSGQLCARMFRMRLSLALLLSPHFFFCIARRHATFIWLVQRNWLVCYMNHIDEVAFSNPYFVSAKCEELNAVRMECTKKHVL